MSASNSTAHAKVHTLTGWGVIIGLPFAAVWYCKLEMDEVIMDYFGGGLRRFGLLKNKLIAFILWAAVAFAVIKLAFLG